MSSPPDPAARIIVGGARDVVSRLETASVHTVVTSPPYWKLRDYGVEGQIGQEATPEAFVAALVAVFDEVARVLRPDGTLWLNLGDTAASGGRGGGGKFARERGAWRDAGKSKGWRGPPPGLKHKDIVGAPWMLAFALRGAGWYLRADVIWEKPNPMPEPARDRPARAHEYLFLLARSETYYYDGDAIRQPHAAKTLTHRGGGECGRAESQDALGGVASGNWSGTPRVIDPRGASARSVWRVAPEQCPPEHGEHTAVFPSELARRCIRRLITYTLASEGGESLRGAGWRVVAERAGGGSWSREMRPRVDRHPMQEKLRWERSASAEPGREA